MIRLYVTPLKRLEQIVVPAKHWLGVRCTAASIGRAQTQRDAALTFSPRRSAVVGA
jgi:hypothetical protein